MARMFLLIAFVLIVVVLAVILIIRKSKNR